MVFHGCENKISPTRRVRLGLLIINYRVAFNSGIFASVGYVAKGGPLSSCMATAFCKVCTCNVYLCFVNSICSL